MRWVACVVACSAVLLAACAPTPTTPPPTTTTTTTVVDPLPQAPVGDDAIRLNQIQLLGSHNSYHVAPDPSILNLLRAAASAFPAVASALGDPNALDYTHAPILAAVFIFVTFSSIGLPSLNGFVDEFLILIGSFPTRRWWVVAAAIGVILAAVYLLWAFQRVFHGTPDEANADIPDLNWSERAVMAVFVVIILFMGLYPRPILDRIEPSVQHLVTHVEQKTTYREPKVGALTIDPRADTATRHGEGK